MLFVFICVLLALSSALAQDLLVQTTLGPVQGHINEGGVREWKGIQYAKAPVGDLRWQYPVFPDPHSEVYQANFDAPGCPQICNLPPGNCPEYGLSENCLFLTVMAPPKPSADPAGYPVFFWIHGGAYTQGLGNCALYNGTYFAKNDVITVVINYRLGALGFMASPSMDGNYGIMDQRLAMQWTKDNIAAFGGNPNKVTIGGQSAGGMSVGIHLTAPGSKGLFQQSIIESYPYGIPFHTRETAGANADSMMTYLGCAKDDVACMRSKSVEEVLDAQDNAIKLDAQNLFINFLPFSPMVDPKGEVPEQPLYAMAKGSLSQTPTLTGTVLDEGQLFVWELFPKALSKIAYNTVVDAVFGRSASDIKKYYPFDLIPNNDDGRNILNLLATDLLFLCPMRNVTRGYHAALGVNSIPTYGYHFEHLMSFDCWGANYTYCLNSVCHGSELPFVFNVFTDGVSVSYTPNDDELKLANDLVKSWSNFITSGNPNKGLAVPVAYPLYETRSNELLVLNEPGMQAVTNYRDNYCDLWDKIGFFW